MKSFYRYTNLIFLFLLISFVSCDKEEMGKVIDGEGPAISGLQITPQSDVQYGDALSLTATLTHDPGLYGYTIEISSAEEKLFEKTQLLTGKSFEVEEEIVLPLPRNATSGDLNIRFTARDYNHRTSSEEITVSNVQVPEIDQLYLILDNNKVFPMVPENGLFVVKDFIPANARGKIYISPDKMGIFWGMSGEEVVPLGGSDITFGKASDAFFEISFDPFTFELRTGQAESWASIEESLYILGSISGHWADGEISEERSKMKMTGYQSGDEKYWTWTPPNDGTGDPETDMWGSIVAGNFRFKLAGEDQYITFTDQAISLGADNPEASFNISVGGAFTINVFQEGDEFTKVSLEDGNRSLEYTSEGIFINGAPLPQAISIGGGDLSKLEGSYFTYEGTVELEEGQTITASGMDLSAAFADPDVFSGGGNSTWTCIGTSGSYLLRVDPLSGAVYVCKLGGYPDVIYLDGWAFGRHAADNRPAWDPTVRMCLYRTGEDFVYRGTIYVLPWGGDVSLWAAPYTEADYGQRLIASKHFNGVTAAGEGFLLPVPAEPGQFYEMSVDLQDGFTFDTENLDGSMYNLVPKNDRKFTVTFTPQ